MTGNGNKRNKNWNEFRAVCGTIIATFLINFWVVKFCLVLFGIRHSTVDQRTLFSSRWNLIRRCSEKYFNFIPLSTKSQTKDYRDFSGNQREETHQHGKCFKMISLARLLKTPEQSLFLSRFFSSTLFGEGAHQDESSVVEGFSFLLTFNERKDEEKSPGHDELHTYCCNVSHNAL